MSFEKQHRRQAWLVASTFVSLLSFIAVPATAHPPGTAGSHDESDHAHAEQPGTPAIFTTREGGRHLPLASDEDVFHFVVFGDRTSGVPAGLPVLEQAVEDTNLLAPDLVMTVGDLVQGYNETEEWLAQMREYRAIMDRLAMRWFPVAGNHDVYWRGDTPPPPGQHESNYEKHFGPLWYSFRHKNAGFIVLYSDEGDPVTNEKSFSQPRLQQMSPAQLAFLDKALAELSDVDHVFVFLHHPRWIQERYAGSNWSEVHRRLVAAGNVSAVFAGHIHFMRYDGVDDGIAYYTLATTGGHLSADFPDAGYLHHMNVVSVRPSGFQVATIPVGAVIDPKEFTPEFLASVEQARSVRPISQSDDLRLAADGSCKGTVRYKLENTAARKISGTLVFGTAASPNRDWFAQLEHEHFELNPGEHRDFEFSVTRPAGRLANVTVPQISVALDFHADTALVHLPVLEVPLGLQPTPVPRSYFDDARSGYLQVRGDQSAVHVDATAAQLPDGPMTLEAWVRPADTNGYQAIIAKTQSSEYALFCDEGVPQFDIHLGGHYATAKAITLLPTDRWTHLAGVYDGQNVRLFVDGRQVGITQASGSRKSNELPLYIGADPDRAGQPSRPFVGDIDEVCLSADAKYTTDFEPALRPAPAEKTQLLLHLDQSLGPFVLDHSDHAAFGTLGRGSLILPR